MIENIKQSIVELEKAAETIYTFNVGIQSLFTNLVENKTVKNFMVTYTRNNVFLISFATKDDKVFEGIFTFDDKELYNDSTK